MDTTIAQAYREIIEQHNNGLKEQSNPTHELNPTDVAKLQHEQWLQHPTTIQMLKNVRGYKKTLLEKGVMDSTNFEKPDNMFRLFLYGGKTIDALLIQIENTRLFLEESKKY